jgi:hypothetical protein
VGPGGTPNQQHRDVIDSVYYLLRDRLAGPTCWVGGAPWAHSSSPSNVGSSASSASRSATLVLISTAPRANSIAGNNRAANQDGIVWPGHSRVNAAWAAELLRLVAPASGWIVACWIIQGGVAAPAGARAGLSRTTR